MRRCLQSLAVSKLRLRLPTALKLEVAAAAGSSWQAFLQLYRLWGGENDKIRRSPDSERNFLVQELRQMLRERPCTHWTPNLEGIVQLVGDLPTDLQLSLTRLVPPLGR